MEYKIKQIPKDFLVWEIPSYELDDNGEYSYFWLRKTNYNTIDAIAQISRQLNILQKNIGFAGAKDKNAITEQVISIKSINHEKVQNLRLKNIELDFIGKGKKPLSLGDLMGNKFRITVRNLHKRIKLPSPEKIPNLFGEQRFSTNNVEIGKSLIKKNFQKAIELINNSRVNDYLAENPGDLIGSLRQIPKKLLMLYVHSYQSYLWNKTVLEYLKTKPYKNEKIQVIGFGLTLKDDTLGRIIKNIMSSEKIDSREFIIRQIPELSAESGERDLFFSANNFSIENEQDELNEGKFKVILSFELQKSSYATIVIEYLFSKLI